MNKRLLPAFLIAATGSAFATPIVDIDFEQLNSQIGNPDGLDDGDRIQDVSGNGYHGFWGGASNDVPIIATSTGTAIDNTLKAGKIILRDGLTLIPDAWDGPTTTVSPYFTFDGAQSYTFEAVVNWNGTTSAVNGLMGQTSGNELWIRESGGFLHYAFVSGAANANLFTNTIDISAAKADSQWHAIAVVYDATAKEIRTYLDGTLKHTNTDTDIGALGTMVNGLNDFSVGGYNGTASNYFNGQQDRYRISTGALSPASLLVAPTPVIIPSKDITWTGTTDGNWDLTTANNWKLDSDSSPALFADNDQVTFSDSAAPFAGPVAIVGALQPKKITVNTETLAYSFSGGSVSGTASLTKAGSAALTLATNFNNSGSIAVNGGTLVVGDGATSGSIGSGPVTLATGTSLKVSRNDTLDYSGGSNLKSISGQGSLIVEGGVTLVVNPGSGTGFDEATSWSTLSGSVTVRGDSELRTLRNGRSAMGSGTVTLGDATTSGSLAQYNGSWTWTNNIALVGPANAIRNRSSASFARVLKLQGVISGSGGLVFEDPNGSMTDNQTGYILTGENTLDGTLTINSGVPVRVGGVPGDNNVTVLGPDAAGSLGTATVVNHGFLTFSRTDAHTVANTLSGDGALFVGLTTGTGTQVVNLTGSVSNTGNTTVRAGTLLLNGTHGSLVPEILSTIQVDAGATLGGSGNTTSDINLNGNLAPGNNTGTLATSNWLVLNGGSSYTWELGVWSGGTAGADSDLVTANEIHIDASAVPATPITIKIAPASLTGFSENPQTFVIAQATSAVVDFNTDAFAIDDSDFITATGATGSWTVQQTGTNIELVYAAGSGLTGYNSWASINGVSGQAADLDHDNDGVSNGVEYFLGGPSGNTTGFTALPGVTNTGGTLSVTWTMGAGYAGSYNTDFVVETSETLLGTWVTEPLGGNVTIIVNDVTYTFPAGPVKKFARLKVTGP